MWKTLKKLWEQDNLLEQAWRQSFEMLKMDNEMLLEAMRTLRFRDGTEVSKENRQKDKLVNKYEREVRRKVMTHCTLQGPSDLPGGMALVSIVIDIERIGDYTKNMVDLALNYPEKLKGGKFEDDLLKVEEAVKENFRRTRDCLESSNTDEAHNLLKEYKWINRVCDNTLMALVKEKDKSIAPGQAVALGIYFRWLKRVNSHLRNITTSVVNPFHRIGFKPKKKRD